MTPQSGAGGCCLTPEDLGDALVAGSPSPEDHVRGCPECRARLEALRRLEALSAELLQEDIRAAGAGDQSWLEDVLANLSLEPKAGRSVPRAGIRPEGVHGNGVPEDSGCFRTEGSIISLIRATGDSVDGTIIGKCRLHGELATAQAPVRVEVSVTALWGYPLPGLAADLRATLSGALAAHTDLNVAAIDILVTDLLDTPPGRADS
ncbi:hypothetical protein GCM10023081_29380 [Arthrobacter ginkgonis]|uniref:Asp23/Gls24 family envelope stress response protein n=1 Tax=Arthrobacter ginkgonis TaxID=1630594 RepID=A0ABP7CI94_9MICC